MLKALDSEITAIQVRLKEREQQSSELLRKWTAEHSPQEFEEKFAKVADAIGIPPEKRTDEQRQQIFKHYLTQVDTEFPRGATGLAVETQRNAIAKGCSSISVNHKSW